MTEKQVWVDQTTSTFRLRWTQPAIVIHKQVGMEQTELTPTASRRFGRTRPIKRQSLHLLLALFTLISLATFAATVLGRMRVMERVPLGDPLLAYADVFPGQPQSTALLHDFSCYDVTIPAPADVSQECVYRPHIGPFSQVNVIIWDGMITQLILNVRENTIRLGDLSILWGIPEFESRGQLTILKWPDYGIAASAQAHIEHCTYFSSISQLWFPQ